MLDQRLSVLQITVVKGIVGTMEVLLKHSKLIVSFTHQPIQAKICFNVQNMPFGFKSLEICIFA